MQTLPHWYVMNRASLLFFQAILGVQCFAFRLPRRSDRWLRLLLTVLVGMTLNYWNSLYLYFPGQEGFLYSLSRCTSIILLYLTVVVSTWVIYQVSGWTALFAASSGYAAQQIAGSVKSLIGLSERVTRWANTGIWMLVLDILLYGSCYLLMTVLFRPYISKGVDSFDDKVKAGFSFCVLMLCTVMARITQDNPMRNQLSIISENVYAIICCLMILLLQFGTMERAKLTLDVDAMRELVHQQHNQYHTSKEMTQLVNEKYHDLKKMLSAISGQISPQEVERVANSVSAFDSYVHTGNKVLDVLLTEKQMLCHQQDIKVTCFLGGIDFSFVEELDLYSLFGNALTNAMEAVVKLPDSAERFIHVTATETGDMVVIHVENPCAEAVVFDDNGIPQSQRDSRYHGFGMQSMERITEKYDGMMSAKQDGTLFLLDLVLFR
ncbi:MAG: ATP-binding protein [Oscillospiraceae bacterium]|nr:ATP-binding protein [Oscillospiraceae bacterium]